MDIRILQLIEGARNAVGITVIIDVFRAFSVEAYLFEMGADAIIPIGDAQKAYSLKRTDPNLILAGERGGKIMPGFDTGNSPSQLCTLDVSGKTVIHTTSAGTQGIANAIHAEEILGCGLVNAKATAEYIRRKGAEQVSLVCMGLAALTPTEEDTLCARYIKSILEKTTIDIHAEITSLKYTSGAKFFDKTKNDVFPQKDFDMCTDVDRFSFVMKLERGEDGLDRMKKIMLS